MIDSATYDDAEARARQSVRSWTWATMMTASEFDNSGFPKRVRTLHELKPLLDAMNPRRFHKYVEELNGLSKNDIQQLLHAIQKFCKFVQITFQAGPTVLPLNTLMSEYLTYLRVSKIPNHESILEIGAGSGYLPFFTAQSPGFERRTQIEVTQSLYLLQSRVNSFLFGEKFQDIAMNLPRTAEIGELVESTMRERHKFHEPPISIELSRSIRATMHPWWTIDRVLDGSVQYDVVVSKGNIAEMSFPAFIYYFQNLRNCLKKNSFILIQDLGAEGKVGYNERLNAFLSFGYKPLVYVDPKQGSKPFSDVNLLLICEEHPLWKHTASDFSNQHFPRDLPLVRAVYGLDRPRGEILSREELFERFKNSQCNSTEN